MCGICGIINFNQMPVDEQKIKVMMQTMKHRGPDDEGIFIERSVGLGFVRLSIIDLSPLGHQPMISNNGRYVLVFNGELYNYLELKKELEVKGFKFKSKADSEVLLNSYIEWGEDCLNLFNGMWAFAIYDRENIALFIARDRLGIKPFYYYKDNEQFIFASEIAPILKVKPETKKANDQIIFDYLLTNRTNHTHNTFFKDIKKLQHSHKITIKLIEGILNNNRWYSLSDKRIPGYVTSEHFKQDFINAINLQLRSDVPIGLCLSGGLDSSSIGATISKVIGRSDIHSFSAIYGKGQKGDESEFIGEFNGYIDNIHFAYPTIDSFIKEMDIFISTLEEPVPGTSEYAEYKVMELANNYCTVLLNGQGVDEYLAGYHDFIGTFLKQRFFELKWGTVINEINKYYKNHKSFYPIFPAIFYTLPPWIKELLFYKKNNYISNDSFNEYAKQKENTLLTTLYGARTLKDSFLNHLEYKFEHHLLWADKSGMQFSLETRFPFLDHNILEKMLNTDLNHIYNNGVTKVILRQAMAGVLPEKIRNRMDKVGYATPEDNWFRSEKFQKYFLEIINSLQFKSRPYFDLNKVYKLNAQHTSERKNNGNEIWKILHLELWFRKFIDKN